mgnify:CR=1 FL=1
MAIATFKRYELKFLIDGRQYRAILPALLEHMKPDAYCTGGRDYRIYNIYYDTDDNRIIRSSLDKPYHKEKLRLRSYSSPTPPEGEVFLEIKKKTGGIVHKRRASMTLSEAYRFVGNGEPPETSDYINAQVIREIDFFMKQNPVHPAAYIAYRRKAFFGKTDRNFRITLDYDVRTRRDNIGLEKECSGEELLDDDRYLMEVKISDSVPLWLADLLAQEGIYRTSFSKYGTEYVRSKSIC